MNEVPSPPSKPKRRSRWILVSLLVFFVLWAMTWIFGRAPLRDEIEWNISSPENMRFRHPVDWGKSKRIDQDPYRNRSLKAPSPPWHTVSEGFSPFPFVVAVDFGFMTAPTSGAGGRIYELWFFGARAKLAYRTYWTC